MSNINLEKLHNYLDSIGNDKTLLNQFISLMDKQNPTKPITLHSGLSVYKQVNTNNYSYRINNPIWKVNERKSCKTPVLEEAKEVARKAWITFEIMHEHNLIKTDKETFIAFGARAVVPPWQRTHDQILIERDACTIPQIKKQLQQKLNSINKKINHLRVKCKYLHDIPLEDLRLKHFEEFAHDTLDQLEGKALSWDTFTNYMTVVRYVLDTAVSEDIIVAKPDTTINKRIKELFKAKNGGKELSPKQINTIFSELDTAIELNEKNLTTAKTSKFSEGKLRKLRSYKYLLKFILATGVRGGDECYLIKWSDFSIEKPTNSEGNNVYDYYCRITGGKIESQRGGRNILVSKGGIKKANPIFEECLTLLAKLQGYTGFNKAFESGSDDYIFPVDVRDVQRYISKWEIFSEHFIPYQLRHSYITNRIVTTKDTLDYIAKHCGNSVEQIQKTYNHATVKRHREIELKNT
jgi:integrase